MPMLNCSSDVAEIRNRFNVVVDGLPEWLQVHTRRVVETAVNLADAHGLDPDVCAAAATGHDIFRHLAPEELLARSLDAEIEVSEVERAAPIILHGLDPDVCAAAATGHDIFRHLAPEELLARSLDAGIEVSEVERAAPIILHGPLAARYAASELGVAHPAILQAIRFHTTCHEGLDGEGLAVFAADKIEPAKLERDPGLAPIADAAQRDLREAAALFLERRMRKQLKRGDLLHPLSAAARNAFRREALPAGSAGG